MLENYCHTCAQPTKEKSQKSKKIRKSLILWIFVFFFFDFGFREAFRRHPGPNRIDSGGVPARVGQYGPGLDHFS